jgi:hypothetical protein
MAHHHYYYQVILVFVLIIALIAVLSYEHIVTSWFKTTGNDYQVSDRCTVVKCRRFTTEDKCRAILESIFKKPFPCVRPAFLKFPCTGKNLELDMYCKELNLAVEFSGQQHYKFVPYFHKTQERFTQQVIRDQYKKRACELAGIHLLVIPYTVKCDELRDFIFRNLYTRYNNHMTN